MSSERVSRQRTLCQKEMMAPRSTRSPAGGRRPRKKGSLRGLLGDRVHGDVDTEKPGAWDGVYAIVRRIPRGRVMTYGQIATLIENRLSPRAVGWAMHGCPDDVPWQRVVNASGGCSTDRLPGTPQGLQRALLEAEGIEFRDSGTLDLAIYRWTPPEHRLAPAPPTRR